MKAIFTLATICLIFYSSSTVLAQWSTQNGLANLLEPPICIIDIFFKNPNEGFMAGCTGFFNEAKLWQTNDGGTTWTIAIVEDSAAFWSVAFHNKDTGYVAGIQADVYATFDGGNSWNSQSNSLSTGLLDIHLFDGSTLIGIGGRLPIDSPVVVKSDDVGVTWDTLWTGLGFSPVDIEFLDSKNGFIVGTDSLHLGGIIVETNDGGNTWGPKILLDSVASLRTICFINRDTGFIGSESGRIYKTVDGGSSWTQDILPTQGVVQDIEFVTSESGFLVTSIGEIYKSIDGGVTWDLNHFAFGGPPLRKIHFSTKLIGYVGGDVSEYYQTNTGGGGIVDYVEELPNDQQFYIYPNPTKDFLVIEGLLKGNSKELKIELYDILGNLVFHQPFKNSDVKLINISHLTPSIYIASIINEIGEVYSFRVLKE